jgi:tetratricopeptide (TPR) repeat protein
MPSRAYVGDCILVIRLGDQSPGLFPRLDKMVLGGRWKVVLWGVLIILSAFLIWRMEIQVRINSSLSAYYLFQALLAKSNTDEHLQQSYEWATRALQTQPNTHSALRLLLRGAVEQGRTPNSLPVSVGATLAQDNPLAAFYYGLMFWTSGGQEQAIILWRSVKGSQYHFMNLGNQAYSAREYEVALRYYEISEAIENRVEASKVLMYRNRCDLAARISPQAAVEWCAKAAEAYPNVWNLLALGRMLYNAGNYEAAQTALEKARYRDPSISGVHYSLGLVLEKQGDVSLAVQSYEQGLKLAPTDYTLNLTVGNAYLQLGEREKAYCAYAQAAKGAPNEIARQKALQRMWSLEIAIPPPGCRIDQTGS